MIFILCYARGKIVANIVVSFIGTRANSNNQPNENVFDRCNMISFIFRRIHSTNIEMTTQTTNKKWEKNIAHEMTEPRKMERKKKQN